MWIDPFWAGVASTIFVELALIVIGAFVSSHKK